ncbi:MAG: diacylglyceryl transferase [Flavobacteriaceae bacterium]|nr:diacylglyceryl transferase [Flavobacteriaceae bacterium]
MERLKKRWGINSNWQVIIILIVFTVTGSTSVYIAKPVIEFLGITKDLGGFIYWLLRILVIFPLYQILLISYGWLFGQFNFFWKFVKKFLSRMGLGFLYK